MQVAGEKQAGIERLGWTSALTDYRPFLSHSELEAFFGSPSGLYELLASVLGLEDLTLAAVSLAQARKAREAALAEVKKRLPGLLTRLEAADDERAGTCRRALAGRSWDLTAARSAVTGAPTAAGGGELDRLRRLAQLTVLAEADVEETTDALRRAAAGLDAAAGSPAGQARALAGLLTAALQHHDAHGDGDCPVCGRPGALTMPWRQATQEAVDRLHQEAQAAESAEQAAADARQRAAALMPPVPAVLLAEPPLPGVDTGPAQAAWQRWASPPDAGAAAGPAGLRALADHLDQEITPFTRETHALADLASAEVARREDRWAPVAAEVASWCADAAGANDGMAPVTMIKAAETWLKGATDDIRNERLTPLAEQARAIWRMLRQESNVDLGAIRLAGSATQRHVELDVSVDGAPGSALGVMSQGEVNALALSVFLPRATLPASPMHHAVAAAVPDRLPGPRHGPPGRIPVRRPQPRLPLSPLRTGPHRGRTHRLARPGRPAHNPAPRSKHSASFARPLKIFMPNGPRCQPPARTPRVLACRTPPVVAASTDDSRRTAGATGPLTEVVAVLLPVLDRSHRPVTRTGQLHAATAASATQAKEPRRRRTTAVLVRLPTRPVARWPPKALPG